MIPFSETITRKVKEHPLVTVVNEEITAIPEGITIIATGPLTLILWRKVLKNSMDQKDFTFMMRLRQSSIKQRSTWTKSI